MKIIEINSSFRKNGNTERLIMLIEQQLNIFAAARNIVIEFEFISLAELDIATCRGCRACFNKCEDRCPLKDDLLEVRNKLLEADGVILGSPIYVEDVNGIMKNWIDRMAFNCHRPAFSGKSALILTTSGAGSSKHALRTMKAALSTWGFYISAQSKFRMGALMEINQVEKCYSKKSRMLADKLFTTILKNKPVKPSFSSLLIFKVQQKYWNMDIHQTSKYDYEFWKNNGWLEPHCDYYVKHKASSLKSRIARFIGGIVALFFV